MALTTASVNQPSPSPSISVKTAHQHRHYPNIPVPPGSTTHPLASTHLSLAFMPNISIMSMATLKASARYRLPQSLIGTMATLPLSPPLPHPMDWPFFPFPPPSELLTSTKSYG